MGTFGVTYIVILEHFAWAIGDKSLPERGSTVGLHVVPDIGEHSGFVVQDCYVFGGMTLWAFGAKLLL